ncbi:dTMP kinase [Sphaerisporangium sp. B11E5]|uniref:dTMP kinase n=1 Tax=Sphaerisporangium sp. B11E5 TaxID=3153563 RepID=UPI00325C6445
MHSENDRHTPGFLVTLDGPSGAGKTTCSRLLCDLLTGRGLPAVCTAQPSDSPIGSLARSSTHRFHGLALTCLVAADRYHHISTVIEPHLRAGHIVVCDRFVPTAHVLDRIDGADEEFISGLYRHARQADLTIFLMDEPVRCLARARQRGQYSRFHHDHLAAAQREHELFLQVAQRMDTQGAVTVIHHVEQADAPAVAAVLAGHITAALATRARRLLPPPEVTA